MERLFEQYPDATFCLDLGHRARSTRAWSKRTACSPGSALMPPCEGGWLNEASGQVVWEAPVLVYTYIKPEPFVRALPRLRSFLHRLGRETNQGEIAVEFDGCFYGITEFDEPGVKP